MDFTSRIGGGFSQLGEIAPGYDPLDQVVVQWIGNTKPNDYSDEMEFPADEGGHPVKLFQNVPTILTKAQAQQAQKDDAVLLILGRI